VPVIKWDDFTGGEYGGLSPGLQSANQWTGLNMLVYDDGRIGPRGGMNSIVTSGLTIVDSFVSAVAVGNYLLVHANTGATSHVVYECEIDVTSTYTHTLAGTSPTYGEDTGGWVAVDGSTAYLATYQGSIYKCTTGSPGGVAAVFTAAAGDQGTPIAKYRDRLYSAGYSNTVRYSVAADFDDWASTPGDGTDSGNFVVGGQGNKIRWMGTVQDQLWFVLENGELWAYQGVPGRDSLRQLHPGKAGGSGLGSTFPVVDQPGGLAVVGGAQALVGGEAYFPRPITWTTGGVVATNYLAQKLVEQESAYPYSDIGSVVGASTTHEDDGAVVMFSDTSGSNDESYTWIKRNGAWSYHKFVPSGIGTSPGGPTPRAVACTPQGVLWLLISSNSETDLWPCYTIINANKPGDGAQTYAYHRQGDVFSSGTETTQHVDNCTFQTSYYMEPSGKDMTIRRVIIEFMAFDTNSSDTNHFDPTIELRASDDGQEQTITLDSWDEANASATSSGSPRRHVVTPNGAIQSTMFAVKLSNIRGVAIESVRVEFDTDDTARR